MRLAAVPTWLAYLPSPSQGVWHLGPVPIRGYALCIILGVVAAIYLGNRRWLARGGLAGTVADIATWAVPAGLVGARVYSVCTDPELYFLHGENPWRAFAIWDGGLGIWGAIAAGALAAYWQCRRRGIAFGAFADALAPAIAVAQAIGRFGNYFNQELFGGPTSLPWGIRIDPAHRPSDTPNDAFYQPTFLYESIWDLGTAALVIWADKKWKLGHGRAFALYVAAYTVGRGWIEALRVDHANHILGLRLNDWTCIICFTLAVLYLYSSRARTREPLDSVQPARPDAGPVSPESGPGLAAAGRPVGSSAVSGHATSEDQPARDGP